LANYPSTARIKVITDSTSDLPADMRERFGIRVVPVYVRFGDTTYRDGLDIDIRQFYSKLNDSADHPATSQPNPEDFARVFKEYCRDYDGIISIHISSRISGTHNSALIAKKSLQDCCPIEVVDSRFNSGGLALVVLAAARMAYAGHSLADIKQEVNRAIRQVRMFGIFQTMKYLAKSGRVNRTIAAASGILHIMPLLTFRDGEVVRAGMVRSVSKGTSRIIDFARSNSPVSELMIVHSEVKEQANELKGKLGEFIPEERIHISELGASLGVHGGPGVLLVALRTTIPS
jgi:DegV family protein with EDD domain